METSVWVVWATMGSNADGCQENGAREVGKIGVMIAALGILGATTVMKQANRAIPLKLGNGSLGMNVGGQFLGKSPSQRYAGSSWR